jgi:hypothetical protein
MSNMTKSKIIEELKKDLFSGDDATVMKAIHRCQEEGNSQLVHPLVALYCTTPNVIIKSEIGEMLASLKVSGVEDVFIEALKNPLYKSSRKELLSFIWSSGLQPVNDVAFIVELAIDGTYEEAIECLTIIESMDDAIPEHEILEGSSLARAFITSNKEDDKVGLIADLLVALEGRTEED